MSVKEDRRLMLPPVVRVIGGSKSETCVRSLSSYDRWLVFGHIRFTTSPGRLRPVATFSKALQ